MEKFSHGLFKAVLLFPCILLIKGDVSYAPTQGSTNAGCTDTQFECNNGYCIPDYWVCDNYNDCPFGEDELVCGDSSTDNTIPTTDMTCESNQFQCWDGNCIPVSWECNGIWDCSQGEDELNCPSESSISLTTTTQNLPSMCENPFEPVGGRCVFVDPITEATWNEARYVCRLFDGDLVVLDSLDFFSDLLHYIKENGLMTRDYWLGGTSSAAEGVWMWVSGESIRMGTPLWAIYGTGSSSYEQEPRGSKSNENIKEDEDSRTNPPSGDSCAYLDQNRFYYMDDEDCDGMKAFICQLPSWKTSKNYALGVPDITRLEEERVKEILAGTKAERN